MALECMPPLLVFKDLFIRGPFANRLVRVKLFPKGEVMK